MLGAMNRIRRPLPDASRCTSRLLASTPATWKTWWVICTGEFASSTEWVRVAQEPLDQLVDAVIEGGGEHEALTVGRGRGQDAVTPAESRVAMWSASSSTVTCTESS